MFPDSKKLSHVAGVSRVIYHNPDDDYVILGLEDGYTATGNADPEEFTAQTKFKFLGKWIEGNRGMQFRFSSFVLAGEPTGFKGILRYLISQVKLDSSIAAKLVSTYHTEAINVLRDDHKRTVTDGILDETTADVANRMILRNRKKAETIVELYELVAGIGISGKAVEEMVDDWGEDAIRIVSENPFKMLDYPSCGFKRCDKLWLKFGLPKDSIIRQAYYLWYWINTNNEGHTWYDWNQAKGALRNEIDGAKPDEALQYAKKGLLIIVDREVDGKKWIASTERAKNERRISVSIHRLSFGKQRFPVSSVPKSESPDDGFPSVHQWEQLQHIDCPVGILTGGPGTGKTFLLAHLLKVLIPIYGQSKIAICAPTGKAAVRATESLERLEINLKATTIHRMLGYLGTGGFAHNKSNPLDIAALVIDESSMIPTDLLADTLDACADGTLVLFIGDPHQLPPVGHGAPLRDLIDSETVGIARLTEVRRNSGAIVEACAQIHKGEPYKTYKSFNAETGENLLHLETKNPDKSIERLEGLLRSMSKFNPVTQVQVLVAMNSRGSLNRQVLNDRLQNLLNPCGYGLPNFPFKVGDKIICLKNGTKTLAKLEDDQMAIDASKWTEQRNEQNQIEETYVANGEIGIVMAIAKNRFIARIGFEDIIVYVGKQENTEERDTESGRRCDFDLAYAISVHKAQGSESPCVVIMADPQGTMICSREWWYTAISRASKLCITIGQSATIEQQRKKPSTNKRKTFLRELLQGDILETFDTRNQQLQEATA